MQPNWQRLEREVERVHRRYHVEVVEALGLCPWAKDARDQGRVAMAISFAREPDSEAAWRTIDATMTRASTDIGIVVFPALDLGRLPFSHFVAQCRAREQTSSRTGSSDNRIALADFHPDATPDASSPERLVPFIRRAPDPMIQVVRLSALEAVRLTEDRGTSFVDPSEHNLLSLCELPPAPPELATRVARNNARTVQRLGLAHVDALICDIVRDRNVSYAALGLTVPRW